MDTIICGVDIRQFISSAEKIRSTARSHRDFAVGCVGVSKASGCVSTFEAANSRPDPSYPKNCAEMRVLRMAKEAGVELLAILVIGDPQPDERSGVVSPTLHPCGECRDKMEAEVGRVGGAVRLGTPIFTVRASDHFMECHTVEELFRVHGTFTGSPSPSSGG